MAGIFTGTIANSLKPTLDRVVRDESGKTKTDYGMWCTEESMPHNWVDDLERAGPGLATEKLQGQDMDIGTIREGPRKRYIARTFALKLHISEEAIEDNQYPEVLDAARSLVHSIYLTVDVDCTQLLVRAFDTNYPMADGLPLASASHTLPHGGTFSNVLATPVSPSVSAFITAQAQIMKLPGHHGITLGYRAEKVVCPVEQWGVWEAIVNSSFRPNVFNEINVVNRKFNLKVIPLKHWANTTTQWGLITDAKNGFKLKWRVRPQSRTWTENDQTVMKYGVRARWDNGNSNPGRSILMSQA